MHGFSNIHQAINVIKDDNIGINIHNTNNNNRICVTSCGNTEFETTPLAYPTTVPPIPLSIANLAPTLRDPSQSALLKLSLQPIISTDMLAHMPTYQHTPPSTSFMHQAPLDQHSDDSQSQIQSNPHFKAHDKKELTREISTILTPALSSAMLADQSDTATVVSNGSMRSNEGGSSMGSYTGDRRRIRRKIEGAVLEKLTEYFWVNDRPSWEERRIISEKVGMSNRDVQVWFQNRRAKERRLIGEGSTSESQGGESSPALSQSRRSRAISLRSIPGDAVAANRNLDINGALPTYSPSPLAHSLLPHCNQTHYRTPTQTYSRLPYQYNTHRDSDEWSSSSEQRRSRASSNPLPPSDVRRIPLHSSPTAILLPAPLQFRFERSEYSTYSSNNTASSPSSPMLVQPIIPTHQTQQRSPLGQADHHPLDQSVRQLVPIPFVGSDESFTYGGNDTKLAPIRKTPSHSNTLNVSTMLNEHDMDVSDLKRDAEDIRETNEAAQLLLSIKN
ncbi:hypothetical protein BATDEDRAFT_27558 [Batrachochytrium dendrobatidis JAM81]|uniref:Homeobox domain-containing protein n=2 Tax=Batrachochytrium dendrobatidis TaxID=109871 RepID=F4PB81_BATDJ|nr:uncharacterized protein BATDEDRAFT_27558 [Batrachochytrium dendrobatidis JAM81]EGF77277.1 hypothetical protein BATDEDRAFT_27558 [Batrachochytrium dendrobatidis JAM81]KAJ8327764.1 Pou2f2p [Batrachochytrium dendrobatidis]KAK5669395.1 Pou2f2p [Batrachochytrium dendrobatidis]OAJ37926.1 hypothetical protein BDEG_21897 [Batrachochytrium dendrobatidis JEL423]|eukprot:XP_006681904.1 hypothetical protein BATDEDRAFT_27558 [Batrachochytrium dendrobatidis JAM81]